ncbi:exodeoxyribonuclease VII small subunit [Roseateles sp. GG27B]
MTATNFRKAYGVLQKHADTLRNQQEPNIDDLLHIVTESVAAYKTCKERIDAVERALEQALGGAGAGASAESGTARPADLVPDAAAPVVKSRAADAADDDLPF